MAEDLVTKTQSRGFPSKLLKFLLLFVVLGMGFTFLSMYIVKYFGVQNVSYHVSSSSQPCIEESNGLNHWIKPPSSLMHKMTDEELFWRASFVPRVKKFPFRRVRKVALMFLTKGHLPLYPLWEKFLEGHEKLYSIYIHSYPSYHADFPPTSIFYQRQIPSKVSEWGKMSMCDAERRLLANALLDISNEWFILLSEACIPLYNFMFIYNYLMKSRYSFVGAFDDPGPYGRGRYNWSMTPEVNISQWRKGSQWFTATRKLVIYIVEDTRFYPKFKEFCRPHCYVDEHYFPTMLTIEAPDLLANRSLTWVDWSRGGAHPATFGKADITEKFLQRIIRSHTCTYNNRNSSVCYLFARKFAPSALDPLLNLTSWVFGFG